MMRKRKQFVVMLAAAVMAGGVATASAQSIDELLNIKPPSQAQEESQAQQQRQQEQPKPKVDEAVVPPAAAGDALQKALGHMRQASDRMGEQLDVGLNTQRLQESALALMDQVITQAQQQQQEQQEQQQQQSQSQGGSESSSGDQQGGSSQNAQQSQSPGQGQGEQQSQQEGQQGQATANAQSSEASEGQAGKATASEESPDSPLAETRDRWGSLPPRLREQLLQGMNERFSPVYQRMTEAYYQRLAEESKP